MPLRITKKEPENPADPPDRSLESRVERLEAIAALFVRHIRGTDVMSDEELVKIERDLQS